MANYRDDTMLPADYVLLARTSQRGTAGTGLKNVSGVAQTYVPRLAMRVCAAAAAGFAAAVLSPFAFADPWIVEGRVVGISDGDTITVLDDSKTQHRVRIAGIDAPEKGQAFGEQSKQNLSALVFQKRVESRCHKKDRYGREVCAVYVARRDVGLEQIRNGMAWWYREYAHEQATQERLVYRDDEAAAKAARRGLWNDPKAMPPWAWRKGDRAKF
ncbi:MAG TPA: thermonuclease family protein [Candidatus Solibacter sp.]|nr:thermonuclease family protein [Candidatus Solibacter sp.]